MGSPKWQLFYFKALYGKIHSANESIQKIDIRRVWPGGQKSAVPPQLLNLDCLYSQQPTFIGCHQAPRRRVRVKLIATSCIPIVSGWLLQPSPYCPRDGVWAISSCCCSFISENNISPKLSHASRFIWSFKWIGSNRHPTCLFHLLLFTVVLIRLGFTLFSLTDTCNI